MTRPLPDHGTRARYQSGCHCHPCTAANCTYQRVYRERTTPRTVTFSNTEAIWHQLTVPGT